MKYCYIFLLAFCSFTFKLNAQFTYAYIDTIEVIKDGVPLNDPWAGGFNSPQFSEINLNCDSLMDLFVYDKSSFTIKTFLNQGTLGNPNYVYAPVYEQYFPQDLNEFAVLADYNNDGRKDIFSFNSSSIIVHKNVTEHNVPKFEPYFTHVLPATIFGGQSNVYMYPNDIPGLVDVDQDGDMDVLTFHLSGLKVDYYENITPPDEDTLILERVTDCWGHFYEHPQNDSIILQSGCKRSSSAARHAGSTITLLHLDDNGLKDLVLGDVDSPSLTALYNTGSNTAAKMTTVEYDFPASDTPADMRGFLGTYLVDVDNDGDKDLIAAPNDRIKVDDTNNVMLYINNGDDNDFEPTFTKRNFMVDEMIDHGTAAHPTFTDVDGDGLLDIIVGNEGYNIGYSSTNFTALYSTKLAFYHNIGTSSSPKYEFITDDFGGFSTYNLEGAYPTFGDLDNDGDQDILLGSRNGWLIYMDNTSGPSMNPTYQMLDNKYFFLKATASATPQLYDINGDSVLDLVVGEKDGYMKLYLNSGTQSSANFSSTPTQDTLGGIHLFKPAYNSMVSPFFANINNQTHLFVGGNFGDLVVYNNIDGNLNGTFTPVDTISTLGGYISPSLANINGNDSLELLVGQMSGGISIYGIGDFQLELDTSLCNDIVDNIVPVKAIDSRIKAYPNPANDVLNLGFTELNGKSLTLSIHDIAGRNVYQEIYIPTSNNDNKQININSLDKGIYLINIKTDNERSVKKIIKL